MPEAIHIALPVHDADMGTVHIGNTHIVTEIIYPSFFGAIDIGEIIEIISLLHQVGLPKGRSPLGIEFGQYTPIPAQYPVHRCQSVLRGTTLVVMVSCPTVGITEFFPSLPCSFFPHCKQSSIRPYLFWYDSINVSLNVYYTDIYVYYTFYFP